MEEQTAEEYLKDKRHLTNRNFPDINEWIVFEKDILKALELKEQEVINNLINQYECESCHNKTSCLHNGLCVFCLVREAKEVTEKYTEKQAKSQAKQELADDIDEIGGAEWQGQYVFDLQLKEWTEIKKRFNLK